MVTPFEHVFIGINAQFSGGYLWEMEFMVSVVESSFFPKKTLNRKKKNQCPSEPTSWSNPLKTATHRWTKTPHWKCERIPTITLGIQWIHEYNQKQCMPKMESLTSSASQVLCFNRLCLQISAYPHVGECAQLKIMRPIFKKFSKHTHTHIQVSICNRRHSLLNGTQTSEPRYAQNLNYHIHKWVYKNLALWLI